MLFYNAFGEFNARLLDSGTHRMHYPRNVFAFRICSK